MSDVKCPSFDFAGTAVISSKITGVSESSSQGNGNDWQSEVNMFNILLPFNTQLFQKMDIYLYEY